MNTDLVIVNDYCRICHIDPAFIFTLQEGGLIDVDTIDGEQYLLLSELKDLERYTRMFYDLSINIEGIDAIHHLLDKVSSQQKEIDELKRKLSLYEAADSDPLDEE
jgi:hypothetical protein